MEDIKKYFTRENVDDDSLDWLAVSFCGIPFTFGISAVVGAIGYVANYIQNRKENKKSEQFCDTFLRDHIYLDEQNNIHIQDYESVFFEERASYLGLGKKKTRLTKDAKRALDYFVRSGNFGRHNLVFDINDSSKINNPAGIARHEIKPVWDYVFRNSTHL